MTLSPKIARALNQAKGSVVHFLNVVREVSPKSNQRAQCQAKALRTCNAIG
jgi:hypothetical protein